MTNTESIKQHLISEITSLNDTTVLIQLEHILRVNKPSKNDVLKKLSKPRKKKLNIEALKKEQKFNKFNRSRFDQLIKELNIQEPIE